MMRDISWNSDEPGSASSQDLVRLSIVISPDQESEEGVMRLVAALRKDDRISVQGLYRAEGSASAARCLGHRTLLLERRVRARMASAEVLTGLETLPGDPGGLDRGTVLLDLTGRLPEDYAAAATAGIWRVSVFGDGKSAALDAILRGAVSVPCDLTCIPGPGRPPGRIARTLVQPKLTLERSLRFAQEKAAQLLLHWLVRIGRTGQVPDLAPLERSPPEPGYSDIGRYAMRVAAEGRQRLAHALHRRAGGAPRPFSLRIGGGSAEDFDPGTMTAVPNPPGQYRADPFLFEHQGALHCFHEIYDYRLGRGHIEVGRIDGTEYIGLGPALTRPYHLSFPLVFRHEGEIYMLPETHQAGRVEIWRCTDFPLKWTLHATALEGVPTVDPVLARHEGRWWLFVNVSNDSLHDFSSELHLYATDGPDLRYLRPHPLNPVVVGSDTARGAGRVFLSDAGLVRPAQDNLGRVYGRGLCLMQITKLNATEYAERRIRHLLPDFAPGLIGCHHIDSCAGRVVIDVRHR